MMRQLFTAFLLVAGLSLTAQDKNHKPSQYNINSVIWQQQSGEYRALCYQAFSLARLRLEEILRTNKDSMPLAIIADIDETILDNSPDAAKDILNNRTYNDSTWKIWVSLAQAKPLAGSVEFFNYAAQHGVQCFYITNRKEDEKAATIINLRQQGFPNSDEVHVIAKGNTSDKESRRLAVEKNYNVVLLLGDNLNDFDDLFYNKGVAERNANVDKVQTYFGSKYIMLPNATYGDWENALWNGKRVNAEERDKIKWNSLIGF